jgi:hypothetical protein
MKKTILWVTMILLCVVPLCAQQAETSTPANQPDLAALQQQIKDLQERVISLEGQVRTLKGTQPSPAPSQPAETPAQAAAQSEATPQANAPEISSAPVQTGGASGAAAKALNPDISVIGDFISAAGGGTAPTLAPQQLFSSFQMHESEIGLQSIIDPYARGDFFISFGEAGVDLEEGYITFTAIPKGFVVRAGKMRSAFGKVNTMHNHVLPWVDRPLVSTNLVGGEDGIDDAGISVQHILPAPKGIFLEATGQLFRGDSGEDLQNVFKTFQRSDVSTVDHLRAYKDITDSTNIDLGLSYARGHNSAGPEFISNLYGIDATLRWKPLRRAIYHSFVARSELIWSQRQQLPLEQRAFGFYASADYQFARRWFLGGRVDRSDRSQSADFTDKGGSVVLTYWPSEFSQLRGQYRFTDYAENKKNNELLMQLIFSLGAHGAHPF